MRARRPSEDPPENGPERGERSLPRRRWALATAASVVLVGGAGLVWSTSRDPDDSVDPGSADPGSVGGGRVLEAEGFGARGDGATDDGPALQRALDALRPGDTLQLRAGSTYAHADVLQVSVEDVTVTGPATLVATDESRSSFTLAADRVTLREVTLDIASTTRRWDAYEQQRLRLDGHTGVRVIDVVVRGSAAAGIYVGGGATAFRLEGVQVSDTRADGIHMTQGVSDGEVVSPVLTRTGDDAVAVVSYAQDGAACRDIVVRSPVVRSTTGGRGLSVVGGEQISYLDIDVRGSAAAAVYVSVEGSPYDTTAVNGVTVRGGTVTDANQDPDIDHGALLVYVGRDDLEVDSVLFEDLDVSGTRASASRQIGLLASAPDLLRGVLLRDVRIEGGPERTVGLDDPDQEVTFDGLVVDGLDVDDPLAGFG